MRNALRDITTFQVWNYPLPSMFLPKQQMDDKKIYLVVLDSLADFHGDREQLVKATDKWISYRVEDKFMA